MVLLSMKVSIEVSKMLTVAKNVKQYSVTDMTGFPEKKFCKTISETAEISYSRMGSWTT